MNYNYKMDNELVSKIYLLEENVASMTKKLDVALEALASFTKQSSTSNMRFTESGIPMNQDSMSPMTSPTRPIASSSEEDKKTSVFTPTHSVWVKLYSDKKAKYFFFNPISKKVCFVKCY